MLTTGLCALASPLSYNVKLGQCAGEALALSDLVTMPQRWGGVTITTTRGWRARTSVLALAGLGLTPDCGDVDDVVDFGFTGECRNPSSLPLLCASAFPSENLCVGAVLSYARQPKHVRKNTGGRDWLRVTLRVREARALRGLS